MANPSSTPRLSDSAQTSLVGYVEKAAMFLNNNYNVRAQLLERDRAYAREQDFNEKSIKLKLENRLGKQVAENVTIPIVMPQVESAVAFLTDKFLTGYPIFPVISVTDGTQPATTLDPAALQMETVVGDNCLRFGWVPELMMCFRDGLKYNLAALEVEWTNKKIMSLSTDPSSVQNTAKTTETYTQGNYLKRLNMYNVIMDTRVANPSRMHIEGEFAGYTELLGKVALKQLIADLGAASTMNATAAFESGGAAYTTNTGSAAFYIPEINPSALLQQTNAGDTNWFAWAGIEVEQKIKYSSVYEVTRLYARIIPSEHGIVGPAPNTPQIWKLIVINRKILIFAERQTNAHNFLGILFLQPLEDGLAFQTKSFAENVTGLQNAASSLYNSGLESQRRKVYDRVLYDPSRVNKKDIDNVSPVARIPVKQGAYGTNLQEAVYAMPYRDDGVASIFQVSKDLTEMSNVVNGQNRVSQGQFQKGNKTRQEFDETMAHSDNRMDMQALLIEYRFFQPLKEIVKLNILQYQPPANLFNMNTQGNVKIDPIILRQASMQFRLADGLLPVSKMLNMDTFAQVMQMAQGNPQFAASYDVMGAFFKFLQLNGAAWLNDFKRTPPQQQQYLQNQQALNGAQTTVQQGPNGQQSATVPSPTQPIQ